MKVRELQQELLNMDPELEVHLPGNKYFNEDEDYEPVHSWDYLYRDNGEYRGIVLWPRY